MRDIDIRGSMHPALLPFSCVEAKIAFLIDDFLRNGNPIFRLLCDTCPVRMENAIEIECVCQRLLHTSSLTRLLSRETEAVCDERVRGIQQDLGRQVLHSFRQLRVRHCPPLPLQDVNRRQVHSAKADVSRGECGLAGTSKRGLLLSKACTAVL